MSAYVIGHVTVRDQEAWAAYRARVPDTLAPWFGELLFRGHLAEVLAGDHPHRAVVALKFPTARGGAWLARLRGLPGAAAAA